MRRYLSSALVLFVSLALVLSACAPAPTAPPQAALKPVGPQKGGTIRVATIGEPPTLDLHTSTAVIIEQITTNIWEQLFAFNEKMEAVPHLAESFKWENNNLKLVITLRKGVLFHDGSELTAEDAALSVERWTKLATLGKQVGANVESVKATDKYTMEINLKKPVGMLIPALANPNNAAVIMQAKQIKDSMDKPVKFGNDNKPIGTNVYMFVEHQPDRHIKLARFDKYTARAEPASAYAGRREAHADEILFIPVSESNTRIAGMESGQYHFAIQIPQDQYSRLKSNTSLDMLIQKPYAWATFVFNKKKGPFTDVRARQAVHYALDRKAIMLSAFGDEAFLRFDPSLAAAETPFASKVGEDIYMKRDVAKAKQLLQEAGYKGDTVVLMTTKEYEWMYKMSLPAKQQMEEAGMKVELKVVDWATLVQHRCSVA